MSRVYKTSFSLKEETRSLLTRIQAELQVRESTDISKSEVIRRALISFDEKLLQDMTSHSR